MTQYDTTFERNMDFGRHPMNARESALKAAFHRGAKDCVAHSMNLRQVSNPYTPDTSEHYMYEEGWKKQEKVINLEYELTAFEDGE